jgi:methanogen extracellular protein (TIGR04279 family)
MGGKLILLLLLIFPISAMALDNSSQAYLKAPEGQSLIDFEGSEALIVPNMSLLEAADETYLFDRLPVYSRNQSINGTISLSYDGHGSNIDTQSKIVVYVSPFNISEYLARFPEKSYFARGDFIETLVVETPVESNDSNVATFKISKKPAGMYTLYVFDENKSTLLSKQPFLITEGDVLLKMDYTVTSLEPFIRIKMNTTAFKNQSKFFAAFMIPREDYDNVSLSLANNRTTGSTDLNLSLGSKSLQMYGTPRISSELLMNLLPLLPQGSAIGLQESAKPGVDIILITDQPWKNGQYILTCGIYSPEKGLIGIKQTGVEVI